MAQIEDLQVYIPQEAEVRRVPLRSLPSTVLQKMGLSVELPDHCVWICPALFQNKGQKATPQARGGARQHMLTVLSNNLRKRSGPARDSNQWKMSFVTANTIAFKVLKETLPKSPRPQAPGPSVPQGPLSNCEQDAIIVYHGRIYLSVKGRRRELPGSGRPRAVAQGLAAQGPSVPQGPAAQGPATQGRSVPQGPATQGPSTQGPSADQSTNRSQMAPETHSQLKRKRDAPREAAEMSQPRPEVSLSQGAHLKAPRLQVSGQSQGTGRPSSEGHGETQGSRLNHGASQGPGHSPGPTLGAYEEASRDQGAQEESSDRTPSQSPYKLPSPPLSLDPLETLSLPYWSPSEPSARQKEFDFQELAKREKIAMMRNKLQEACETDPGPGRGSESSHIKTKQLDLLFN